MRIAIVDDISEERTLLRNRLESQFSRRNVHVDIFEYENGETFLTAAKECPFTVVFLDIYMNGSNGIDTAKELRRSDTDCLLVFTTTSTDHALEGFQVRALHYLVKPYSENDISALADEILSRIPDSGKYIDVKVNGSNIQIPFRKIIYLCKSNVPSRSLATNLIISMFLANFYQICRFLSDKICSILIQFFSVTKAP